MLNTIQYIYYMYRIQPTESNNSYNSTIASQYHIIKVFYN